MVDIAVEDTTLTATDRANRSFTVETAGWDRPADGGEIPLDVDESIAGRVESLSVTSTIAEIRTLDGEFDRIQQGATVTTLDDEEYVLKVTLELIGYIRFRGPAELRRRADGTLRLEFEHPTPVTIGFWSLLDYPEATVTVEPTPTGIARGIQALPSSHITPAPERVMPGWRDHPPRLELGAETSVPDAVADDEPDTGIELVLPDRLDPLYPAASLAHYLGAAVSVTDRAAPLLRAPSVDLHHEFDQMPRFQHQAAATLRRTLYLDSVVKSARPGAASIVEESLTDRVDIDVDDCYERSPAERLRRYLAAPVQRILDDLPERNYAAYVPPDPEYVGVVPFVVRHLGHLYAPSALDGAGGAVPPERRMEGVVDRTDPDRGYHLPPETFDNALEHLTEGDTDVDVVVVDNADGDRAALARAVYAERSAVESGTVTVEADLATDRLRDLLESRTDVIHFVADDAGLACPDGRLDPSTLDAPRTRIAVLDAPETTAPARRLVAAGGVLGLGVGETRPAAGALENVLELLVQGFSVALAVDVVREVGGDLGDLGVVGDGTHNVFEDDSVTRLPLFVRSLGEGTFEVRSEPNGPTPGLTWHPDTPAVRSRLLDDARFTTTAGPLAEQLDEDGHMIVHDGECYRSEDVDPFYPGL